jgi:hypothetical protein
MKRQPCSCPSCSTYLHHRLFSQFETDARLRPRARHGATSFDCRVALLIGGLRLTRGFPGHQDAANEKTRM